MSKDVEMSFYWKKTLRCDNEKKCNLPSDPAVCSKNINILIGKTVFTWKKKIAHLLKHAALLHIPFQVIKSSYKVLGKKETHHNGTLKSTLLNTVVKNEK